MPFINIKATISVDSEMKNEITENLLKITQECLGKGENWIMINYDDPTDIYFQGSTENPSIFVEVKLYGKPQANACQQMTKKATNFLAEKLHVSSQRIYIAYYPTNIWGWDGNNF